MRGEGGLCRDLDLVLCTWQGVPETPLQESAGRMHATITSQSARNPESILREG